MSIHNSINKSNKLPRKNEEYRITRCREARMTHGRSAFKNGKRARVYSVWASMKERCNNRNNPAFGNYGGRGIKVCKKWMDFIPFQKDIMKLLPEGATDIPSNLFLERKNNDKGYRPSNVTLTTRKINNRNKRNVTLIRIGKLDKALYEWVTWFGGNAGSIGYRIRTYKEDKFTAFCNWLRIKKGVKLKPKVVKKSVQP